MLIEPPDIWFCWGLMLFLLQAEDQVVLCNKQIYAYESAGRGQVCWYWTLAVFCLFLEVKWSITFDQFGSMEIDGPCRGKRGKISLNSLVIKILVQILAASQDTKSTDSPVVSQSGRFVFQEIYTKISPPNFISLPERWNLCKEQTD